MPKVLTWLLTISLIFVVLPAVNPVYAENSCNFGSGSNEGQITLENDDILQVPASTAANYTLSFKLDSKAFSLLQGTHIRLETGGGWFGIGSVYTNITHITSDRFTITLNRSQFPNTSSGLEAFNKFASSGDHNIGVTGVTGGVTPLCHLTYKISPTGVPSGSTGGSGNHQFPLHQEFVAVYLKYQLLLLRPQEPDVMLLQLLYSGASYLPPILHYIH